LDIEVEVISTAPRAFIIDRFLSDFETDAIIGMAKDKVERSSVGNSDDDGGRMSDTRTSRNTWLARNRSPVLDTIARRAADTLMLDEAILVGSRNAEHMQVVHYVDGQRYDSHHDWGVSGRPESRYITMLFYLNNQSDVHAGGETSFPKAQGVGGSGIKVRPVKGSSIIFYNLLPDGNGDDLALHAALPVSRGEKWLANYWIWDPVKNK
jgi:prolyl 4-hydroxylase